MGWSKGEKPLIIHFWTTWCDTCKEETAVLKKLYRSYGTQIDFYAVNVTWRDKLEDVKSFAGHYDVSYPVLLDPESKAASAYRIRFVPSTFLVDREGNLVEAVLSLSYSEWESRVLSLIGRYTKA
ncbi:TlpA family protein disulfide reductase [Paenibacillus solisilvae]|uniref:TlpA family protein disulfide reductase n=1 Tax=Paenibacillus solisilvae TaxID=2486751 RepID=A0ABW0W6L6_9BACL